MSTPPSYQDVHVRSPAAQEAPPQQVSTDQATAQQPAPQAQQSPTRETRVPLEDRQLSVAETEALLRGVQPEPEQADTDQPDPDQLRMVQEFFPPSGQVPPQLTPQQVQQIAAQPPQVPVQGQQPQPPPQPIPIQSDQLAALQAQNQLLQAQIQQMMQMQQQPQPQPRAPQAPVAAPAPTQQFQFNVPDQYMNALAADDINVRRMALNGLLNGVAESVAQQVRQDMDTRLQGVAPVVQAQLESHQRGQMIQNEMYGTYPELVPYKQFVRAAAGRIAGNLGYDAWSPDVRDAIAEQVAPMVPGLMQKIQSLRAQRIGQVQNGGYGMPPQMGGYQNPPQMVPQLPQVPAGYSPQAPVMPHQQAGGVVGSPVYVRDAAGRVTPYYPQQPFVAGQQTRPGGRPVDAALQDIWSTLGYQ